MARSSGWPPMTTFSPMATPVGCKAVQPVPLRSTDSATAKSVALESTPLFTTSRAKRRGEAKNNDAGMVTSICRSLTTVAGPTATPSSRTWGLPVNPEP